ncbi:hypothetical protein M404DRAFT_994666 [Pisolithus tinctorius Marx 270]|uniref:IBB domain-containing protein n=1 Tax=Pisolithus tinctorius Marx 270 TaxID=870435 RepID=A0A0C3JP86_PISTI|nr:hypothetical protein M404DRAFT_994666 [Pisolithus tinctorius Marx 270]
MVVLRKIDGDRDDLLEGQRKQRAIYREKHRKRAEKEKATGMKKDADAKTGGASINVPEGMPCCENVYLMREDKNRLCACERLRHLGQPQTDRLWMQNGAELFMLANESMLLARTIGCVGHSGCSGSDAQSPVDEDYPFLPFPFGYA